MMMINPNRIFIFSQPIRSGKTTLLLKWLQHQSNVAGILTPDLNKVRQLYNIETRQNIPLQLSENQVGITIGRFVLDKEVIALGRNLLLQHFEKNPEWLIIDEIGPLEINHNDGWEPAFTTIFYKILASDDNTKILVVVRENILQSFLEKYQLHSAQILHQSFFQQDTLATLNGLVLCGGESKRMQQAKALLQYHDKPQYQYAARQLQPFCTSVYISLSQQRAFEIDDSYSVIFDKEIYKDTGPICGLLSASEAYPNQSYLMLGCDYPYLTLSELLLLYNNRSENTDIVCFENSEGFVEPLIAIYEATALLALKKYFGAGGRSLRKFTALTKTKILQPQSESALQSFDSLEDFERFKK